ncbi:sulfotransferase [Xanthomonas hortorum]|uniref:sulfotransferase n=1 Tax=Xanthomonas hortorum TaxID=56454 RepID=UPI002935F1FD|nr:sulfotransferase [Xanthomonas hortorum]MDV2449663.1 sulfotransferase [Xanthomonas hortorum NBC5720]
MSEATTSHSKRSVVLILGMHRSGTSALTRVLNLLGIPLGSQLLQPQDDNNNGFWEHTKAVEIHERVLTSLGRSWHDMREMPAGWLDHPASSSAIEEIMQLIAFEMGEANWWMVKDPRMCRLVPLWLIALERLDLQPRAVLVVRDPREVALSLRKRDGWQMGHSYLMWIQHLVEALIATPTIPRAMVAYSQLLQDWRSVVAGVARSLDLEWPTAPQEAATEIDRFINPNDRHQRVEGKNPPTEIGEAPLPYLLESAYELAQSIANMQADWPTLNESIQTYQSAASVFSLPVKDLVLERNELEQVALERMDVIGGLLGAKEALEQHDQAREGRLSEQAQQLELARAQNLECQDKLALASAQVDAQARELEALRLDHRELLTIRQSLERERFFVEHAFARSDQLQTELRAKYEGLNAEHCRLLSDMSLLRSAKNIAEERNLRLEEQVQTLSEEISQLRRAYNMLEEQTARSQQERAALEASQEISLEQLRQRNELLEREIAASNEMLHQTLSSLADYEHKRDESHDAMEQRLARANMLLNNPRWLAARAYRRVVGLKPKQGDAL